MNDLLMAVFIFLVGLERKRELVARSLSVRPRDEHRGFNTGEEPGSYTYYCSVAGHREAGMEGELIVD